MTDTLTGCLQTAFTPFIAWLFLGLLGAKGVFLLAAPAGSAGKLKAGGLMLGASALGLLIAAFLLAAGIEVAAVPFKAVRGLSHFLLSVAVIHTCGLLVFEALLPITRLRLSALVQDIILAVAYAAAALTALSNAGANLSSLLATSAVVTAVMAFSLQDTLGNIFGGMVLQLEQSFAAGDRIRSGEVEGLVREIRWRQTTLETLDGDTVIIPNSALMKSTVTVLGRQVGQPTQRFASIPFNVYYDRSPGEVIAAVQTALREDLPKNVASNPLPDCIVAELKDTYAVYAARYYLTNLSAPGATAGDIRARIYYALTRAGIKLSNPSRAVLVMQKDEDVRERSKSVEQERRLSALRGIDIFGSLTPEELGVLAERLKPSPFCKGELITRQGTQAEWLYILHQGEAEVRIYTEDGAAFQTVARLKPGDFVGEMGLMTGEPRTATVVAVNETGCYRLDREAFTDVLIKRPAIAESISMTLARRRTELGAARVELGEEARRQRLQSEQTNLLSRIKNIFSINA